MTVFKFHKKVTHFTKFSQIPHQLLPQPKTKSDYAPVSARDFLPAPHGIINKMNDTMYLYMAFIDL